VGHSISPRFQQAAFDALSLHVRYELWDTPADRLADTVRQLRSAEFLGANVTVPHKEAVARLVDEISSDADLAGAVNTIVNGQGRLLGHNTDVGGFRCALREALGAVVEDRAVVVLGAGGGARAVVVAVAQERASRVLILNRTAERANRLAAELGPKLGVPLAAAALDARAASLLADYAVLVNCTSVGLAGGGMEQDLPLAIDALPEHAAVVDIIANPLRTRLLKAAAARGHPVLGGLAMLVHQGALAFELWTGLEAPVPTMMAAADAAMGVATGGSAASIEAKR
jgi:shikimate dehydrogenase